MFPPRGILWRGGPRWPENPGGGGPPRRGPYGKPGPLGEMIGDPAGLLVPGGVPIEGGNGRNCLGPILGLIVAPPCAHGGGRPEGTRGGPRT